MHGENKRRATGTCGHTGSCNNRVCSLSGSSWFITSARIFRSKGSSGPLLPSLLPRTCCEDRDAHCKLEPARGTSFFLPPNSPLETLLLGLAFQFFGKKENNKGEDKLRFFYIFSWKWARTGNLSQSMGLLWGFTIPQHLQSVQLDAASFYLGDPFRVGLFLQWWQICVLTGGYHLPATPLSG